MEILSDRGYGPLSPAAHRLWLAQVEHKPWSTVAKVDAVGDVLTWMYDEAEMYIHEGWLDSRDIAEDFVNQFAG